MYWRHCLQAVLVRSLLSVMIFAGLRSVRYYKEVPGIHSILANDLDPAAVESITRNVEFNGISLNHVIPNQGDARYRYETTT